MDTVRDFDDEEVGHDAGADDAGVDDTALAIGTDERRMHVRAYNHWVSLLGSRAYPSIEDLDPGNIADFGPNSVLLDFSKGVEDPTIPFLGRALREECGLDAGVARISDVPGRSLLSRLTDHYLQIIANRAPIGFEAEFIGTRGYTTLYRGILMPFSSDQDTIDFIYGVINWKEVVDPLTQASLSAELEAAVRSAVQPPAPAWADGPSAGFDADADEPAGTGMLADQLMLARESAAAARAADTRTRAALYRALGRAHDFGLAADRDADGYARLLDGAGIAVQARAPMTPIVKLVFGSEYDKTRLTEFATVLAQARAHDVPAGGLGDFLDEHEGGIKGVVKAARAARRPAAPLPVPVRPIAERPSIARLTLKTGAAQGDVVLLVARVGDAGALDVVGTIHNDAALLRRAVGALD